MYVVCMYVCICEWSFYGNGYHVKLNYLLAHHHLAAIQLK